MRRIKRRRKEEEEKEKILLRYPAVVINRNVKFFSLSFPLPLNVFS